MPKKALIVGITGQDGTYLARLLLKESYEVHGTSRDAENSSFSNLKAMGIYEKCKLHSMAVTDFRSVIQVVSNVGPDEIYNLSGQSSVGLSFDQPVETLESISVGTLNLLEVIRFLGKPIRFYNAGSGECFGECSSGPADESGKFRPKSPYAVAKSAAFWQVANYREAYGLFACSGILFNHESPLRPLRFVTRKIVSAACRIALGKKEKLWLGKMNIQRDWGWAPEYVEAMWLMLQQKNPDDYVIATGESNSLESFVEEAFQRVGLRWQDHVVIRAELMRPSDISIGVGNPRKARDVLGWSARSTMKAVVQKLVTAEMENLSNGKQP